MHFLEDAEATGLTGPVEPASPTSVSPQPFPFLRLPREIRDLIYYYTLLRSYTGSTLVSLDTCFVSHKAWDVPALDYWGSEKATRLFRVNHQISNEAIELFYSSFTMQFDPLMDVDQVNATFRDMLSPRIRGLISTIGFTINSCTLFDQFTLDSEEKQRQAFEALVQLLPNMRHIKLTLSIVGPDVRESQYDRMVSRILTMLSPLKGAIVLVLEKSSNENAQRTRISSELREVLGSR